MIREVNRCWQRQQRLRRYHGDKRGGLPEGVGQQQGLGVRYLGNLSFYDRFVTAITGWLNHFCLAPIISNRVRLYHHLYQMFGM